MISVQFLSFLLLMIISMTMAEFIQFDFLNGISLIRCSDNQLQIHQSGTGEGMDQNEDMLCDTKKLILDKNHAKLRWEDFTIRCLSSGYEVRDEQLIRRVEGYKFEKIFTNIEGHLSRSKDVYKLEMGIDDDDMSMTIASEEHAKGEPYFIENGAARVIYLQFVGHQTTCRIVIIGKDSDVCKDGESRSIDDADYTCYTDPWMNEPPSPAQLEAELQQADTIELWQKTHVFVLALGRPKFSVDTWTEEKEAIIKPSAPDSKNITKIAVRPKANLPKGSPKSKKKSSPLKLIGIIVGILLLVALIGGVAFYVIQKQHPNPSASLTSVNVDHGKNKDSSPANQKDSDHSSLGDDDNAGAPIDQRSYKDKPNIGVQKSAPKNKAQRGGTNLAYNYDG